MGSPGKISFHGRVTGWLGRVLFGNYDRAVRRKHVRALCLALALAVIVCLIVAGFLYVLYQRDRY